MQCIILAAGYGTRLQKGLSAEYKHLQELPKALLPVHGTTLLDGLLQWIPRDIKTVLVTNAKYYARFKQHEYDREVVIINDGTKTPEERLGAIGDLSLALEHLREDDTIVLASDVKFFVPYEDMLNLFNQSKGSVLLTYREPTDIIHRKGVVELDGNRIIGFEEKPAKPKSRNAAITAWFMRKECIPFVKQYTRQHPQKLDRPGDLLEFLVHKQPWFAFLSLKSPLDIAGLDTYKELLRRFE